MSAGMTAVVTVSASSRSLPRVPPGPDVLAELLHAMIQPLTGLRCALELSLARSFAAPLHLSSQAAAEQQRETVVIALQQTEKVIGMVQLMREYVDAEQLGPAVDPCP